MKIVTRWLQDLMGRLRGIFPMMASPPPALPDPETAARDAMRRVLGMRLLMVSYEGRMHEVIEDFYDREQARMHYGELRCGDEYRTHGSNLVLGMPPGLTCAGCIMARARLN